MTVARQTDSFVYKRRTQRSIKLLLKAGSHLCTLQALFTRMNLRSIVEMNEDNVAVGGRG